MLVTDNDLPRSSPATSAQQSGDFRAAVRRLPRSSPATSAQQSDDFRAEAFTVPMNMYL
jgi:hypothetical protein